MVKHSLPQTKCKACRKAGAGGCSKFRKIKSWRTRNRKKMKRKEATARGRAAQRVGSKTIAARRALLGDEYDAVRALRVVDLKERLAGLDLATTGLKAILVKRLRDALADAAAEP